MNKSLLIMLTAVLTLVMTSAHAQGFEFCYGGESLEDNATVTIMAKEDVWGELSCETNPAEDATNGLVVALLSNTQANMRATLEITSNTFSAATLQWCMGGECLPFGTATKLVKQFRASSVEQVQFDAYAISGKGSLTATLTVTASSVTHTVNIRFIHDDGDGIHGPIMDNGQWTMDNEQFIIHNSQLTINNGIYTLSGQRLSKPKKGVNIIRGKKVIK